MRASREYGAAQIAGLHVPLAAVVDVLGFRVLAVAVVPHTTAANKTNSSVEGQWGSLDAADAVGPLRGWCSGWAAVCGAGGLLCGAPQPRGSHGSC